MIKALLAIARQIALAHEKWRADFSRRHPMLVEVSVLHERLEAAQEQNALLRARLRRLPPRRRPHYRAHERLAILWHAARYGLSMEKAARAFVVSVGTILNWRRDAATEPSGCVQAKPPVNKLPDLVTHVAQKIKREWPRWGTRRIAGILMRLGLKVSRTSVQAFLRRPHPPAPPARAVRGHGPLVAKRPGHLWFIDFTKVGSIFRSVFVGAVIDGYSRKVLAIAVAPHEPSAAFAVRLVREAIREAGAAPTWMVSDHGTQLTATEFVRALRRDGIRHRYGAVHRYGSLAIMERFWKSMKTEYANGLFLFRPLRAIERDLARYATWFNRERPHQGLDQRTPDEVHFRRSTRAKAVPLHAALTFDLLDGDRELPVLRLRHAA